MSVESALSDVSLSLGVPENNLRKLIEFESHFDPMAKNPYTGASGLIQFMDSTARSLGYGSATELVLQYPDAESQLRGPVLKYLSQYKPFNTPQSLYLAVFYPSYRFSPLTTEFPDSVKAVNPGIKYVGDYVAKIDGKKFKKYSFLGFILPIAAVTLAVFYPQLKRSVLNVKGKGN